MIELIGIALLTIFASTMEFVAGFGISTIMIPLLMLIMPPVHAIFFVSVVDLMHNAMKAWVSRNHVSWDFVLRFGTAAVIGAAAGALTIFTVPAPLFQRLVGALLLIYVWFIHYNPQFKIKKRCSTMIFGGAFYGFIAGLFGIGGVFRTAILLAYNLSKVTYLATHSVTSLLVSVSRIGTYVTYGVQLPYNLWIMILICIPLTYLGVFVGQLLIKRIPQERFRQVISYVLAVMGIKFLLFP